MTWNDQDRCPACGVYIGWGPKIRGVDYAICPCGTIFTTDDISLIIKTQNDRPDLRNNDDTYADILRRVPRNIKRALDYGCGTMELVSYMRRKGIMAEGIDQDTTLQLQHLEPLSYDAVFMVEVIEHLYQPRFILEILASKLKPGGVLYVETTFADGIKDVANHEYVDPRIGHVTILSRHGLEIIVPSGMRHEWVNDNVVMLMNGGVNANHI